MPEACLQAFEIYLKFKAYPDALRVALRANDRELQKRAFSSCGDFLVKQQLCHILARQVGNVFAGSHGQKLAPVITSSAEAVVTT